MADCFFDDSCVEISWFQGTGKAFAEASRGMYHERGMHVKHRLGPVLVTLNGERAVATVSGIIDIPQVIDGVAITLSSHTLFLYKVEKRQGAWGLMSFEAIYRRDEIVPVIPGQTITVPEDELRRYRPSYRYLAWINERNGYVVNNDLAGEDRPETVAAILQATFDWAGLAVPD